MNTLHIEATDCTPEIELNPDKGTLLIRGESYPENVTKFYEEFFTVLNDYLDKLDSDLTVTFELIYFNSSSVKVFMNLFILLDEVASKKNVHIIWRYQDEDETIHEFGESFSEDLENAKFSMQVIEG